MPPPQMWDTEKKERKKKNLIWCHSRESCCFHPDGEGWLLRRLCGPRAGHQSLGVKPSHHGCAPCQQWSLETIRWEWLQAICQPCV